MTVIKQSAGPHILKPMNYKPMISTTTGITLNERFEQLQDGLSHVDLPDEYAFFQMHPRELQQTAKSGGVGRKLTPAMIAARKLKAKSIKDRLGHFSYEHHISKVDKEEAQKMAERANKWRAAAVHWELYFRAYRRKPVTVTKEELDEEIEEYRRLDKRRLDKELDEYMVEAKLIKETGKRIVTVTNKENEDWAMNCQVEDSNKPLVIDQGEPAPASKEEKMEDDDDW